MCKDEKTNERQLLDTEPRRNGKLDPVIGRDNEIRRVVQAATSECP